jgi:hypothetical protein
MPEYVYDEAFEHRLERVLREIGNEAVVPFDPYETTQMIITNSRIGGVPITAISAAQIAQQPPPPAAPLAPMPVPAPVIPPPGPPPGYYDEQLPEESRRWPLFAAIALLIAALVFTGFATGFVKLPSGFGITYETPGPTQTVMPTTTVAPTLTAGPTETPSPTPRRTKKPRRTPRPDRTTAPAVTDQPPATTAPTEPPTEPPTPEPAEPTTEPAATQDAATSPN